MWTIFTSVNAIQEFLLHELILVIHSYDQHMSKADLYFIRTIEIKGLCLQLKRSGTKYAAQKINFLASAVANGCLLPL